MERDDVRVVQRSRRAGLATESGKTIGIPPHLRRQNLERHRAAQSVVGRTIDFAHPARADERDHFIRAKSIALA
jgi:hypothetical protein